MLLQRYRGSSIQVVYEAGCFGFWLHDRLIEQGVDCFITPPSLIPQEYGNRVKTDRKDSPKLAQLLAKGLLKRSTTAFRFFSVGPADTYSDDL